MFSFVLLSDEPTTTRFSPL